MSMWIESLTVLCEWGRVSIDKESIEAKNPKGSC